MQKLILTQIMLGRVISFGDTAYITDTIILPVMVVVPPKLITRPNTIVSEQFLHWSVTVIIHVTLQCKILSDTIVLGRVINQNDTTNITDTIVHVTL
jgi:hypothetical protein